MARPRIHHTEEERKEANRVRSAKYRENNKEAHNKANRLAQAKWQSKSKTHFLVYAHTNSKGNIYIGSGHNLRPYQFSKHNRSKVWHEVFDNECEIKILGEFKTKEQALIKEKELINAFGLSNLVNSRG